jgi:large subunit ribosomal protein L23
MTSVARRLGRVVPLPNLRLRLNPPRFDTPEAAARGVDEVVFVTTPDVTKIEVRAYLERALNVGVESVHTANYEGRKRRDRGGFHRRADFKKVYVTLTERWFPPEAFRVKAAPAGRGTGAGAETPADASS